MDLRETPRGRARNLISTQPVAVALEEDLAGARQLGVEEAFSSTTTRAAAARRPHVEFDAVLPYELDRGSSLAVAYL